MSPVHPDDSPLRLTPTLVELLALLTVGLVSLVMLFFLCARFRPAWSLEEVVLGLLTLALTACTFVVWQRSPYARAAALVGLVLCLCTAPPLQGLTLLAAVPLGLLIWDRHAYPEANLLRRTQYAAGDYRL
jgi:hypothetical protein